MTTHGLHMSNIEMIKPRKPTAARSCDDRPKSKVLSDSFRAMNIGSSELRTVKLTNSSSIGNNELIYLASLSLIYS